MQITNHGRFYIYIVFFQNYTNRYKFFYFYQFRKYTYVNIPIIFIRLTYIDVYNHGFLSNYVIENLTGTMNMHCIYNMYLYKGE